MSVINNNLLLTADAGVAPSAYQIQRSLRFNRTDSAYLNRTPSVAGNRKTWTWAGWVKRSNLGVSQMIFGNFGSSGVLGAGLRISANNTILFFDFNSSNPSNWLLNTTAVFRDTSAWYHIVAVLDTTNAIANNRVRLYVNGIEQTSFSTRINPALNYNGYINNTNTVAIGRQGSYATGEYFTGYLADVHFIDGQALTPSSFTETNATTGQLVPKAYTGTYGTNGFRLNFSDNSAATAATLGADSSGNGNNWTPNNLSVANSFLGGNNGTLNGPTYSSANGGSIVFDGSNDFATIPNSSSFDFETGDFTVESWIRITSLATYHAILEARAAATAQNYLFGIYNNGGTLRMDVVTAGSLANRFGTTTSVPLNTWAHVVWVRSGGIISYYVNTIKDATTSSYAGSVAPSFSTIYVGAIYDGFFLNGNISTIRIYKSKALSASEITQNYNAIVGRFGGTSSGSIVTSGLVLNLDAGNITSYPGTGTTWTDISTRTNPGIDSLTDTPTSYGTDTGAGGEVRGNYCTLNPVIGPFSATTFSNGNLDMSVLGGNYNKHCGGTILVPQSGKFYFEVTLTSGGGSPGGVGVGFGSPSLKKYGDTDGSALYLWNIDTNGGVYANSGSTIATVASWDTNGSICGCSIDYTSSEIKFYVNNSLRYTLSGANFPSVSVIPFINNSARGLSVNFGQRPFAYAAPSGFKALCDTNLPAPTIAKGSSVFDTTIYTGTGAALTPTSSLAFSPDLVWIKGRSGATDHALYDTVRGATLDLVSNSTAAETTQTQGLTAFNSNGFTVGTLAKLNTSAATYAGWAWDAGSSTVTNTDGSITSQVRANASAGFSVVSWTGTGASGGTIGHGLNVVPEFIFAKARTVVVGWPVYHKSLPNLSSLLVLQTTDATVTSANYWGSTAFTSNVFNASPSNISGGNWLGADMVAYCFAAVTGYSSFGSYTGNGSADGPFVYLGFRPAFLIMKRTNTTGNWVMLDSKREGYNVDNDPLYANLANVEGTTDLLDITSNGFKLRSTNADCNASGGTYIYAAFAENPFQYARAR